MSLRDRRRLSATLSVTREEGEEVNGMNVIAGSGENSRTLSNSADKRPGTCVCSRHSESVSSRRMKQQRSALGVEGEQPKHIVCVTSADHGRGSISFFISNVSFFGT